MATNVGYKMDSGQQSMASRIWSSISRFANTTDMVVAGSFVGRAFCLGGSDSPKEIRDARFTRELLAGLATFFTMSYIIAVNAAIISQTGGPCLCEKPLVNNLCQNEAEYQVCRSEVQLDLTTATPAIAALASILFGLATNLPVALAPGMGLNAYFAYQIVGVRGSGAISYGTALLAVFVEGIIFMILSILGLRQWFVKVIPATIKTSAGVGIGLLLTMIGMASSEGIGIISGSMNTPLAITGCDAEDLDPVTMTCNSHVMASPRMWTGILLGGLLTTILLAFRVRAAIIIGIFLVAVASWFRDTPITYFPHTPDGDARFEFFRQVVAFHPIKHTLGAIHWNLGNEAHGFWVAMSTMLFVDLLDSTTTMFSMVKFTGRMRDEDGDFDRSTLAYCTDAFCISIGALLGTSPVTTFLESGAGIAEGGRTGLTAITTGCCFFVAIFFAPIFASIPPWATGCALILVGCLMIRQVTCVNWSYVGDAIPSFVVIAFIPFTFSVAYGLIAGLFTYTILNGVIWLIMHLSGNRLEPADYELKEYWTWKPAGNKPWLFRFFSKGERWGNAEEQQRVFRRRQGQHHIDTNGVDMDDVNKDDVVHMRRGGFGDDLELQDPRLVLHSGGRGGGGPGVAHGGASREGGGLAGLGARFSGRLSGGSAFRHSQATQATHTSSSGHEDRELKALSPLPSVTLRPL